MFLKLFICLSEIHIKQDNNIYFRGFMHQTNDYCLRSFLMLNKKLIQGFTCTDSIRKSEAAFNQSATVRRRSG